MADQSRHPNWTYLGLIEEISYDGPIMEVHAWRDQRRELRVEIRLCAFRHVQDDYVSITPTFKVMKEWMEKAEKISAANPADSS